MPIALLVDTNYAAAPIMQSLREAGCDVHFCGSDPADYLARMYADKYICLDYSDHAALEKLARDIGADYIVPGCNDRSYAACAAVAKELGTPGLDSPSICDTLNSKQLFREFSIGIGLPTPKVYTMETLPHEGQVIVKPVDAFSGRGVTVLDPQDISALSEAIRFAESYSRTKSSIIEEFVEGQLFSHSAFIVDGRVAVDFVVIEWGSANPFVVDTSYVVEDFDELHLKTMRDCVSRIASVLTLKDGLLHTQFVVTTNGIQLIEVTRRCPGDLYSQLIELSTGFPYARTYAAGFINEVHRATSVKSAKRYLLRHTVSLSQAQAFAGIAFLNPVSIEQLKFLAKSGDLIRESPFGRIALLLLNASSAEGLKALARQCIERRLYQITS